jgi:hypothetical protein
MLRLVGYPIAADNEEGLAIEGSSQCQGDRFLWTRLPFSAAEDHAWYANVETGKCLHLEGANVVQRTCDFNAAINTHPQLWDLIHVKNENGLKYRQLMHYQSEGGVKCLTTSSVYPFYIGTISLGECAFPANNVPFSNQYVSAAFHP